ncbi:PncA [[Pantoea] beijingensis]|uniref:Nicotinamidase n=1 Tax=[Pantoea] beijingensis TaxID=1324864 RepID=A0A443II79_9GAMM|nr:MULTISPECIES: bifunctional nicotinamidase/pyrazinamidase [Erwiniaceae]RWR03767.1 PncA [[Pantoea] beijingensis]
MPQRALVLIDLQNDFCAGGALAVQQGDEVIVIANQLAQQFRQRGDLVIATQDWHPADHGSFASVAQQPIGEVGELNGLSQRWWPDHAVQHTPGADFHPDLDVSVFDAVFRKGEYADVDSYSAFFDNGHQRQTQLHSWLQQRGISSLVMMGLATDYCVKFSVLDALALGYNVEVIRQGCRGVNTLPEDSNNALREMATRGATVL